MIEIGAHEAPESIVAGAFESAIKEIAVIEKFQSDIIAKIGRQKADLGEIEPPEAVVKLFAETMRGKLEKALFAPDGESKRGGIATVQNEWRALAEEKLGDAGKRWADAVYETVGDDIVHDAILDAKDGKERRVDGRGVNDVRPLYAAVGLFERNHGMGLFYRGGTHIMSFVTLGGPKDSLLIEGMEIQESKHFMHHYNFPPFSTGETGRMGSPGRREIGHGALAEKALLAVIPPKEEFPYTIRIVSECMASSGSTSQGSICASTLALMDAGVPIKAPVAGIAIGLVLRSKTGEYKILTDIQGLEDHFTDMDFKVAGTRNGVTAVQMDVKVGGVPVSVLTEALARARDARMNILDVMEKALPKPRPELKDSAPRIITVSIDPNDIGEVIGPGGKVIKSITEATGAQIDVEQDGTVFITSLTKDGADEARRRVEDIVRKYAVGDIVDGTVAKLFEFGAVVQLSPTRDGLVHISEMATHRVDKVEDIVKVGDTVKVQVIEVGDRGKLSLSMKRLDPAYDSSHPAYRPASSRLQRGEQAGDVRNGNGRRNDNNHGRRGGSFRR